MSRRAQFILFGILVFLIIVFAGLNLTFSRYGAFWRKEGKVAPSPSPVSLGLTPTSSPLPLPLQKVDFASPVEKKYVAKVKFVELNWGQKDLGFYLPEGSEFYAMADGSVDLIKGDFHHIFLLLPDGTYLKYLFTGEPSVKKGAKVKKGDVLGKVGKAFLPVATGDRNLIVSFFKTPTEGVSLDEVLVGKFK